MEQQSNLQEAIIAIEAVAKEFLSFAWTDVPITPSASQARYERIYQSIEACGPLNAWAVCRLFFELEALAQHELAKAVALAQTTTPEDLLSHGLPEPLINNVLHLKDYEAKEQDKRKAQNARKGRTADKIHTQFTTWARTFGEGKAHPKNIKELKELRDFSPEWNQTDKTLKAWWKEVHPDHEFQRGAPKK